MRRFKNLVVVGASVLNDAPAKGRSWSGARSLPARLRAYDVGANLPPMNGDWLLQLEKHLIGRRCEIGRREYDWVINFVGGGSIALPVPWRIVADGRIAFANEDDGQKFGLPAAVDGTVKANTLIGSRSITGVSVDSQTADLTVHFGSALRLDAFNNSSGYEGWHVSLPSEHGGLTVIALGGGDIAIF